MRNEFIFKQVKLEKVISIDPIGYRCYAEVLFENGYQTSVNIFENTSAGTVKDSYLGMVIPEGKTYITFKVMKKGFGTYNISKLSLKMLGGVM